MATFLQLNCPCCNNPNCTTCVCVPAVADHAQFSLDTGPLIGVHGCTGDITDLIVNSTQNLPHLATLKRTASCPINGATTNCCWSWTSANGKATWTLVYLGGNTYPGCTPPSNVTAFWFLVGIAPNIQLAFEGIDGGLAGGFGFFGGPPPNPVNFNPGPCTAALVGCPSNVLPSLTITPIDCDCPCPECQYCSNTFIYYPEMDVMFSQPFGGPGDTCPCCNTLVPPSGQLVLSFQGNDPAGTCGNATCLWTSISPGPNPGSNYQAGSGYVGNCQQCNCSSLTNAAIVKGGTGYTKGDVLAVNGGVTNGVTAFLQVASVNATGVITGIQISSPGLYFTVPINDVTVSGGTGTNATFHLTWISIPCRGYWELYNSAFISGKCRSFFWVLQHVPSGIQWHWGPSVSHPADVCNPQTAYFDFFYQGIKTFILNPVSTVGTGCLFTNLPNEAHVTAAGTVNGLSNCTTPCCSTAIGGFDPNVVPLTAANFPTLHCAIQLWCQIPNSGGRIFKCASVGTTTVLLTWKPDCFCWQVLGVPVGTFTMDLSFTCGVNLNAGGGANTQGQPFGTLHFTTHGSCTISNTPDECIETGQYCDPIIGSNFCQFQTCKTNDGLNAFSWTYVFGPVSPVCGPSFYDYDCCPGTGTGQNLCGFLFVVTQ